MGKKFIDKSKAVTYRLVPRETGPDQFEEDRPKYTFVVVPNKKNKGAENHLPLDDSEPKSSEAAERHFPSKGPRPDWDPDIVACLDDDFDFNDPDNALDDDFVQKANAGASLEPITSREKTDDYDDGENSFGSDFDGSCDEEDSFDESFQSRKGKSKLTQYSMTSAISNCTEDVQILNDKFEQLLEGYDDDQIGALDGEDIGGIGVTTEHHLMAEILNESDKIDKKTRMPEQCEEELKNKILETAPIDDSRENLVKVVVEDKCIDNISLCGSSASTMYHPAVIPVERQRTTSSSTIRSSARPSSRLSEFNRPQATNLIRLKNETPEQRRERKNLVKAARKESRMIKSEVKLAFKNEKKKQSQEKAGIQKNIGFKL